MSIISISRDRPMQKSLMAFPSMLFVLLLVIVTSYSPAIATPAETPKPKITIFKKQASKAKSILYQGDALLAGTNIQISIKDLGIGSYSLLMERNGKEKTTLVEKIKIDKKTKILIPSTDKWLTISNNTGDYKLIASDSTNGKVVTEFSFLVLPSSEKVDSTQGTVATLTKNLKITQTKSIDFLNINIPKMNPTEIENVFALAKKTTSNIQAILTRGRGSTIYKSYAAAVALVVNVQGGKKAWNGSGIILNTQGDIITNHHVAEGADSLKVILLNHKGKASFDAKLEHCAPGKDLALIKLNFAPPDIQVIELGSNKDASVGDDVHAIGHPLGQPWVYTRGPIGQIFPDYSWKIRGNQYKATLIQTQTPINPGNSGGPLITDQGKVIGVNTLTNKQAQGVNFAVSVDDIKEFYQNRSSYPCDKVRVDPKPKPVAIKKNDTNGVGKVNEIITDLNRDGKGDLMLRDTDHDGKPDRVYFDTDGDGYFETRIFEKNDMYIFLGDSNKDGKYDKIGYDYDKDFVPDKIEDYYG